MVRAQNLSQGASGAELRSYGQDSGKTVIKINTAQPQRIQREIDGTQLLLDHPAYRDRILHPIHVDRDKSQITYPFINGMDLRTAIVEGHLQDDEILAIAFAISRVEMARAHEQTHQLPGVEGFISMQRMEWENTLVRIAASLREGPLSQVDPNAPIIVGGKEFPSLNTAIREVNRLLVAPPPYTDIGHNDLTQSNVLLLDTDGVLGIDSFIFIDHEWAGHADPAESYVRTAKARKTYDLAPQQRRGVAIYNGSAIAVEQVVHSPSMVLFETQVARALPSLADAYRDPDFGNRFRTYLAGSYLREAAMSTDRSGPNRALCAMMEASMAIAEAA